MAKKIVRLTTAIGETVNNDPDVSDLLKVLSPRSTATACRAKGCGKPTGFVLPMIQRLQACWKR